MTTDLNPLFIEIEAAVDAHPVLRRWKGNQEASMHVARDGWTALIWVKVKGSNKRAHEIRENGATPEEAARKLISALDIWAQVL